MAYGRRGQFTAGTSRSGKSFYYGGRRVLIASPTFQLEWAGESLERFGQDVIKATFEQCMKRGLEYMESIVPVDTGELRDSLYVRIRQVDNRYFMEIGARAGHAIYVELGTYKTAAQPFIRPTFDRLAGDVRKTLREEARKRGA